MDEPILPVLAAARARLNAAIVAHRALAWAAPAAVAAGLAAAGLHALGILGPAFIVWASATAALAAAGAATALKSRLDAAGAARWLDERLEDDELLSAALVCLSRGSSERFDAEVVKAAEEILPRAQGLRASAKPLARKAALAAAGCAIGAYLIFLASPLALPGRPASTQADKPGAAAGADTALALAKGGSAAAAAFANSLFPDDKRRATLAERALREGRLDDLRDMLRAADLEYETKLNRSLTDPERRKLAAERDRIQSASDALAMDARTIAGDPMAGQGDGKGGGQGEGEGGAPGGSSGAGSGTRPGDPRSQGSPGTRGNGQGEQGSPSQFGSQPGQSGGGYGGRQGSEGQGRGQGGENSPEGAGPGTAGSEGSGLGGSGAGKGSGSPGGFAAVEPSSSPEQAVIGPSKQASFFEIVLPGRDAAKPITELAPGSGKSAESAMSREGVPLEYEDFVRSYFMSLSKGESR
jgi:hypothetical protein